MSVSIAYYQACVKLAQLKNKFAVIYKDVSTATEVLKQVLKELEGITLPTAEAEFDIAESIRTAEALVNYYEGSSQDFSSQEFLHLAQCLLETYFVYLDTEGTDVERVSWLEASIDSFMTETEKLTLSDVKSDKVFEQILWNTKGDIDVTYYDSFPVHLQEGVRNFKDFSERLQALGNYDGPAQDAEQSNIFG